MPGAPEVGITMSPDIVNVPWGQKPLLAKIPLGQSPIHPEASVSHGHLSAECVDREKSTPEVRVPRDTACLNVVVWE